MLHTIRDGNKLFLIGPRRFGKTSILKASEDQLYATDAVVLRFDAESYPSLDLLVAGIIASTAKQLRTGVERAGEQIRKFFSRLRPEIDFSLNDNSWTAKVGVAPSSEPGNVTLLVEVLNSLEALAQSQPKQRAVGLVIDEFQKLIELGGEAAEGQIRAAIQRHKRSRATDALGTEFMGSDPLVIISVATSGIAAPVSSPRRTTSIAMIQNLTKEHR